MRGVLSDARVMGTGHVAIAAEPTLRKAKPRKNGLNTVEAVFVVVSKQQN
jgi:hypothetical protein